MSGIYFINEQHERNFKETLIKWSMAKSDAEYRSACYILSVPMIYEKVESLIPAFEKPVDWIWQWETAYSSELRESLEITEMLNVGYDLTSSMIGLGKLALNLWNSYPHFNFLNCISSLDAENYNVMICAIDIRMRKV